MGEEPLDVLEARVGEPVTVQLKDGTSYHGSLAAFDQHMNLVLDPTPADDDEGTAVDNTTIIRGDNVVSIRS